MLNFITRWRREREAVRELSRLSDRELADLGIARSDIRSVAAGTPPMTSDEVVFVATLRPTEAVAASWGTHNRRSLAA